jgi:hypothetical protein
MALAFEYFDADGAAVAAGVFLPVGDLPGLEAAELAAAAADKESKAVLAVINQIYETLSPGAFDKLGWAVSKGNPAPAGVDTINQSYSFTSTYVVNLGANTVGQIPVPAAGDNADVGKFGLVDIFPGASKVAAAGNTGGAGLLIVGAEVEAFGATYAGLTIGAGEDNRNWIAAFLNYLAVNATLRTASVASAVTAASRGTPASTTPAPALTAASNPTSGLSADDLPLLVLFTITYGLTVQLLLNQSTQSFDVRHVTT